MKEGICAILFIVLALPHFVVSKSLVSCYVLEPTDYIQCIFPSLTHNSLDITTQDLRSFRSIYIKSAHYLRSFLLTQSLGVFGLLYQAIANVALARYDLAHLNTGAVYFHRYIRNSVIQSSKTSDTSIIKRSVSEDLCLEDIQWSLDLSLSVIMSNSGCFDLDCLDAHMQSLTTLILPAINSDLGELLHYFGNVRVVYGYAGNELTLAELDTQCESIRNSIYGVEVYCKGYYVEFDEERDNYVTQEMLARVAYQLYATDYYLFLDNNVLVHDPSWLATAVVDLLSDTTIHFNLGITVLGHADYGARGHLARASPSAVNEILDFSYLKHYPLNLVMHKSHFEMFSDSTVLLDFVHPSMNNYLLVDLYRTIGSVYYYGYGNVTLLDDNEDMSFLMMHYSMMLDAYIAQLHAMRVQMITWLNAGIYQQAPIPLLEDSLRIQPGDTFYMLYCTNWLERCESANSSALHHQDRRILSPVEVRAVVGDLQHPHSAVIIAPALLYQHADDQLTSVDSNFDDTSTNILGENTAVSLHTRNKGRVAVITAIYGGYESTCKEFTRQSVATDFYCFTDNPNVINRNQGWIVDTTPYHLSMMPFEIQHNLTHHVNSFHRNKHPFNVAKYYKVYFNHIPCLQGYEAVVWIDGTIRISDPHMAKRMLDIMYQQHANVISFEHIRQGSLQQEVKASIQSKKYNVSSWGGFEQPIQDVEGQYKDYVERLGFNDIDYWRNAYPHRSNYGLWCTCFVAYDMRSVEVLKLLEAWSQHVHNYTTQDQISFAFVVQHLGMQVYSLPSVSGNIYGSYDFNALYSKMPHGM